MFGDPTIASTMIDRVSHHTEVLSLKSASCRIRSHTTMKTTSDGASDTGTHLHRLTEVVVFALHCRDHAEFLERGDVPLEERFSRQQGVDLEDRSPGVRSGKQYSPNTASVFRAGPSLAAELSPPTPRHRSSLRSARDAPAHSSARGDNQRQQGVGQRSGSSSMSSDDVAYAARSDPPQHSAISSNAPSSGVALPGILHAGGSATEGR